MRNFKVAGESCGSAAWVRNLNGEGVRNAVASLAENKKSGKWEIGENNFLRAAETVGDLKLASDFLWRHAGVCDEALKRLKAMGAEETRDYHQVLNEKTAAVEAHLAAVKAATEKAAKERAALEHKVANVQLESEKASAVASINFEKEKADFRLQIGTISLAEHTAQLKDALDTEYSLERTALKNKLALEKNGTEEHAKTIAEMVKLEEKYNLDTEKLALKSALHKAEIWKSLTQSIDNAFHSSIQGMIQGTQTLAQAVANMGRNIIASFADSLVKILSDWVNTHVIMKIINAIFHIDITAQHAASAATQVALTASTNVMGVMSDAALGAAAAWASTAAIPIIGPFLAPEVAATTYAGISGFAPLASAAGGWQVPYDTIAQVHKNEMILPAHLSRGIAGLVEGGGTSGGENHYHFGGNTFQAMDAKGMDKVLKNYLDNELPKAARRMFRDNKLY